MIDEEVFMAKASSMYQIKSRPYTANYCTQKDPLFDMGIHCTQQSWHQSSHQRAETITKSTLKNFRDYRLQLEGSNVWIVATLHAYHKIHTSVC